MRSFLPLSFAVPSAAFLTHDNLSLAAYFILTPSGHLHIYGPPPATVTAAATAPSTSTAAGPAAAEDDTDSASLSSDKAVSRPASTSASSVAPLTPSAQHLLLHSSPHLSLNLALCTLGPMPTPAPAPSPNPNEDAGAAAKAAKKKQPLDAVFTLIETLGKAGKGEGSGARHVVRCKGVDGGWEEMGGWVASIGKVRPRLLSREDRARDGASP